MRFALPPACFPCVSPQSCVISCVPQDPDKRIAHFEPLHAIHLKSGTGSGIRRADGESAGDFTLLQGPSADAYIAHDSIFIFSFHLGDLYG
jgi:hypothetical protein